jgi:hypothetical protein
MPADPQDPALPRSDGAARMLEGIGVAAILTCLGAFLLGSYSLIVFSDPMEWYLFGRDLAERFADTRLAYGFPLLMAGAIAVVGPIRAYLVNLPVVIAMAGLFYLFARQQVRTREPAAAALGAAAGLAALVWVDTRLVLGLVNPYRDALSYLLVLLAGVLVIRGSRDPQRAPWLAAAAGAALAAATSTRETSILMLLPFALYAGVARLADARLPLLRCALTFAAAFAVGCLPLLVQNQLASGSALVPGQAAEAFADEGSLTPGVRLAHLPETLPQVVSELRTRLGPVWGLVGLGVVLAAWRRQVAVLALSLPALCLYVLFYGAYARRVTRYLFAADLFAFCLAAAGVALLVDLVLTAFRRPRRVALPALALGMALTAWVALESPPPARARLTLDGVERFVRDFEARVPVGATVVGMRPLTDLVRGFTAHDVEVVRNLWDLHVRLPQLFGQPEPRVLLARTEVSEQVVAGGFDLEATQVLDPADYGLQRHFGEAPIRISDVVPWDQLEARATLQVDEPGWYVLAVDLGRFSQQPRSSAALLWNGVPLDGPLADGLNHLAVSVEKVPFAALRLVSDAPVPGQLDAEVFRLRRALTLDFREDALLRHVPRFSWSFLLRPRLGFPSIARSGHVDVPTLRTREAAYVVDAQIGLVPGPEAYTRTVSVEAGARGVGEWTLGAEADDGSGPRWSEVSFVLHEPFAVDPRTRLHWSVQDDPAGDPGGLEPALGLREIRVRRVRLRDRLVVEPSSREAEVYLGGSFGKVEPRVGRWTGRHAELRLLMLPMPGPGVVSLRYVSQPNPTGPVPRPTFVFDGRPAPARFSHERGRTTAFIPIEAGGFDGVEHRLEILLPEEAGRGVLLELLKVGPFDWSGS